MILVLEIGGLVVLLGVVAVLFRAAQARPDDPGFLLAARAGLAAWVAFAVLSLVDFGAIFADPWGTLRTLAIIAAVVAVVLGYRALLRRLKERADGQ